MSSPLVILDIGSTLVGGPASGPASRIAASGGLTASQKRDLNRLLMTTDHTGPAELIDAMRDRLALSGAAVESAVSEVWTAQESEGELLPGVAEALEAFVDRGYQLAVLSNIWTAYLRAIERLLGGFFEAHIPPALRMFSCREGLSKPHREVFDQLLKRAGRRPENTLMVGDSYKNDMAPAIGCGMHTLWLLHSPVRERPALVSVINGLSAAPTLTLPALADLDFDGQILPRIFSGSAAPALFEPHQPVGE